MKPSSSPLQRGLSLLCLFTALLVPCQGEVVLGNLASFNNDSGPPSGIGIMGKALSFTMEKSYVLQSVTLRLYRTSPDQFSPIVDLWTADKTGKALAYVATLNPPEVSHNLPGANYAFSPKGRLVLQANNHYCIVLRTSAQTPNNDRDFLWQNGSPTVNPTGAGATFLAAVWGPSYDEPYSWTKPSSAVNWFEIQGEPL